MQKREKEGDSCYSHDMGTEDNPRWCRGYAHKSSPGWAADRATRHQAKSAEPTSSAALPSDNGDKADVLNAEDMNLDQVNQLLFGPNKQDDPVGQPIHHFPVESMPLLRLLGFAYRKKEHYHEILSQEPFSGTTDN